MFAISLATGKVLSFDAQGNIYLGIANPGPLFGTTSYPLGSSRPGPDLYTDSVVKLSPAGKPDMIIAYKLGATGKLPDTVGS